MNVLDLLDAHDSDLPAELWVTGETAWHWRAEQTSKSYFDWRLGWVVCEPPGERMRSHP